MLSELNNVDETSQWKKVKSAIDTDRRYKLIDSSIKREQYFYDYVRETVVAISDKMIEPEDSTPAEKSSTPPKKKTREPSPKKQREPSPKPEDDETSRQDRMEASMRKRQMEVDQQMEAVRRDRDSERSKHSHEKAREHFTALLADLVRDSSFTWKETRRVLRKDPRWGAVDILDVQEKESLFEEHIADLRGKRRSQFRKMLDENGVTLDARWRDVRKQIKDDIRYTRFGTSEQREDEFEMYLREKTSTALNDFKSLLRETRAINYKTKKQIEENSNHQKDIIEVLKKDQRYLLLEPISHDRDKTFDHFLEDLQKSGPPPPPTATQPSMRYRKD